MLVGLGALAAGTASLAVPAANAANGPTFRDCAFFGGIDPDFVQLFGATVTPQGTLTVLPSQNQVQLEASESSDPGDSSGHVTLTARVTSATVAAHTVSGAGTGKVFVSVPLEGSGTGKSYTISWAATFDNGEHKCPSAVTPGNETPKPFVVTVAHA
jgi:hypothetical protein